MQLAADALQLFGQQHEDADAGRTQVAHFPQVENDAVAAHQQRVLQGLAEGAAPGGIHPPFQFDVHVLAFETGANFHGGLLRPQSVFPSRASALPTRSAGKLMPSPRALSSLTTSRIRDGLLNGMAAGDFPRMMSATLSAAS